MESGDLYRGKEVTGHFPEYGAIFMSNRSTFKECLEKRLLGLPSPFSSFVKSVKAGMVLFLFEFEERKLYGVFQAISNGGMNIVPHAYISSGKKFPAQVKFTTKWHCDPLLEDEFRDAIQDNYFETYKFNFGLSMDQTQSLLWLFNSKILEIPKSLHRNNKRQSRMRHCKSIEARQKKGRFTEIQISERKSNMDHDISEPEVKRLSLSSNSSRGPESINFDDGAYDPEHPGFHYSEGSGMTHSAASHESHELLALQQKEENSRISAEETQDYIPLFPSDHSDSEEEEELNFSECSVMKFIELGIVGNQVSSIPVPQFALGNILSSKGSNEMKMEHLFASTHGSSRDKLHDSSNAALPLSDTSDSKSEDGRNNFKSVRSKGIMYSDKSKPRASVFSRLNFSSKYAASENHEECEKMKNVTQQKHEIGDRNMNKRTSVFLRLTGASDAVVQPGHCMTELNEGASDWKNGREKRNFQNGNINA